MAHTSIKQCIASDLTIYWQIAAAAWVAKFCPTHLDILPSRSQTMNDNLLGLIFRTIQYLNFVRRLVFETKIYYYISGTGVLPVLNQQND